MTENKGLIDDLAPADPLMAGVWYSALNWCIGDPEAVAAFRHDTGNTWTPGKTGIDQMVDEATGADKAFVRQFAEWFTINVWSEEGATDAE